MLAALLAAFAGSIVGRGQSLPQPPVAEIVRSAAAARQTYLVEFKNLISNETRRVTVYDKDGDVKRERTVISKFVVYGLTKDSDRITEFRNVTAVDGKPVSNPDKRVEDFFQSLRTAESSAKELQRIERESQRYDEDLAVNGFTLFEGVTLAPNLTDYFEYTLAGRDVVEGNPVYLVDYRQTKPSPYIKADGSRPPEDGTFGVFYDLALDTREPRLNGRLWIDAANYRIWREKRTMTLRPEGFERPVVAAETLFEYQPSEFGILTPKRIVHTQFALQKKGLTSRKDVAATLEYEKFRRPDVDVKVIESPEP
jgi:hypothetical protein